MMATHTPAWKRLGLQLKTSAAQNEYQEATPPTKKRKLSSDDLPPRLENIVKGGPKKFAHLSVKSTKVTEPVFDARLSEHEPTEKPKKERKSVSFSAGVKENSAAGVHIDAAVNADGKDRATFPGHTDQAEPVPEQKKKKKQREEDFKSVEGLSEADSTASSITTERLTKKSSPPYLRYLAQYANDRASWKFNKSHQIKLLDNLFNLNRIPATYDAALIDYVKGLQGAGVRTRLKEDAERVLSEAPSPSEDAAANGPGSDTAIADLPEDTSATSNDDSTLATFKAKQVARAQAVLAALATNEPKLVTPPQTTKPASINGQAKAQIPQKSKRSRGRVRRGLDDVPSSDESSILSESSSDEAGGD